MRHPASAHGAALLGVASLLAVCAGQEARQLAEYSTGAEAAAAAAAAAKAHAGKGHRAKAEHRAAAAEADAAVQSVSAAPAPAIAAPRPAVVPSKAAPAPPAPTPLEANPNANQFPSLPGMPAPAPAAAPGIHVLPAAAAVPAPPAGKPARAGPGKPLPKATKACMLDACIGLDGKVDIDCCAPEGQGKCATGHSFSKEERCEDSMTPGVVSFTTCCSEVAGPTAATGAAPAGDKDSVKAQTTLAAPGGAGGKVIELASVTGFSIGDTIVMGDEYNVIKALENDGTSVVLLTPLVKSHASGVEVTSMGTKMIFPHVSAAGPVTFPPSALASAAPATTTLRQYHHTVVVKKELAIGLGVAAGVGAIASVGAAIGAAFEKPVIETHLLVASSAGDYTVQVADLDKFKLGTDVVIDEGTEEKEVSEVASINPLGFKSPLKFPHAVGVVVRHSPGEAEPEARNVALGFAVENVDFSVISAKKSLLDDVTANIKDCIANAAGTAPRQVELQLSAGGQSRRLESRRLQSDSSLLVDALIKIPSGVFAASADTVKSKLATSKTLEQSVVRSVKQVSGIESATVGVVSVGVIKVATLEASVTAATLEAAGGLDGPSFRTASGPGGPSFRSAGTANNSSVDFFDGSLLSGCLIALMVCVVLSFISGVAFCFIHRRQKRGMERVYPASPYFDDGVYAPQGQFQVPPGFGYDEQGSLMGHY